MNVVAALFGVFFKISLLCIGGGYNMIPLMQEELAARGWLDAEGFMQVLALSEVTPGPVAINVATFAGYRTAGLAGAAAATAGVGLPGMLILVLVGGAVARWREHRVVKAAMRGMVLVFAILQINNPTEGLSSLPRSNLSAAVT